MRGVCAVKLVSTFILWGTLCSGVLGQASWKFIAVGDSRGSNNGVNTTILSEIASEIVSQNAEFVLFPGDLVNGSSNASIFESQLTTWRNTMQPVYDAGIGVYAVRGNHDNYSLTAWNNVFSDSYSMPGNGPAGEENLTYSITRKNAFVVGLDEYVSLHRVNQGWLDSQLTANSNPHIFVFGHEPAFKANHPDCLDDYVSERNAFWESLEGAGGRTYFCGHDHFYDHAQVDDDSDPSNDIHQYIVGTAGAPLYSFSGSYNGNNSGYTVRQVSYASEYGYVLGEIDGLDVTLTWMERAGAESYAAGDVWSYTAVPEPATILLAGMSGLAMLRRRRAVSTNVHEGQPATMQM